MNFVAVVWPKKNTFWLVSYPMLLGQATVCMSKHTYACDDNRRQWYQLCVSCPLWSDPCFHEFCCRCLAKKITFCIVSYPIFLRRATVYMSKHTYAWDDNRRQWYQLCVSCPLWSDCCFHEFCCRCLAKKSPFG